MEKFHLHLLNVYFDSSLYLILTKHKLEVFALKFWCLMRWDWGDQRPCVRVMTCLKLKCWYII